MTDTGEMAFQAQQEMALMEAVMRRLLARVLVGVVLIGFAVAAVLVPMTSWFAAGFAFATTPVLALFMARNSMRQFRAKAAEHCRPVAYRIDGAGIHTVSGFTAETMGWAAVTGVKEARGQVILSQGWLKMVGIPTGGLSPAEVSRLIEVLRSRGRALAAV